MANSRRDIHDATGRAGFISGIGWTQVVGTKDEKTPTNGRSGFAPGCLWQNVYATAGGPFLYVNTGSSTSATWVAVI